MSSVSLSAIARGLGLATNAYMRGDDVFQDAKQRTEEHLGKIAQSIAATRAQEEVANLNRAKAAEVNVGIEMSRPESIARTALLGTGIPLNESGNVSEYLETGSLGGKYRTPEDGVGPVAPQPSWAGPGPALEGLKPAATSPEYKDQLGPIAASIKAMQIAAQRGDKNSENVAKATGIYNNQDRIQQTIDGKLPASSFAQAIAASEGKPLTTGHEFGVVNNYTGEVSDQNPVAQRFGKFRDSGTAENVAQAGSARAASANSYAAADAHKASAAKTRQETLLGAKGQYDPASGMVIDTRTGTARPVVGPDGQQIGPKLKDIPASVNTAITTNVMNMSKAQQALDLLNGVDVGKMGGDREATGLKAYAPQAILNWADPKGVEARAALTDVGSLVLHDRSGAAVTASESPRLMPFIPQPTDNPEVARKKMARFVDLYKEELRATGEIYNTTQGYKENPVVRRINEELKSPGSAAKTIGAGQPAQGGRQVIKTGTAADGRRVVQYNDGSIEYAN